METSRETYEGADQKTQMGLLYDFHKTQNDLIEKIHKLLKGDNGKGLITNFEILKVRVGLLTVLLFSILGLIKWG